MAMRAEGAELVRRARLPELRTRALATGRSKTLGVVTFDTTLYGPASTLLGIEHAAHGRCPSKGHHLVARRRWHETTRRMDDRW
jgi:hypothetical protein